MENVSYLNSTASHLTLPCLFYLPSSHDIFSVKKLLRSNRLLLESLVQDVRCYEECWDFTLLWKELQLYQPEICLVPGWSNEKLVEDLYSISRFEKRDFEVKRKYEYMHNLNAKMGTGVKMGLREVDHDKAKKAYQTEVESIMKVAQIHIVVATLIMTVTFVTGITLPGGFESDSDNPNQWMAILIRNTTFCAFVVSDAISFTFSVVAIFIYFLMADTSRDPQSKKIVKKPYDPYVFFSACQC
ncbi:hypothetical protein P3L10_008866 [Capsicum annuum]